MMLPVPPVEQTGKTTVPVLATVKNRESATVFRQMEDVFRFLRFCLRMNAFMIVFSA